MKASASQVCDASEMLVGGNKEAIGTIRGSTSQEQSDDEAAGGGAADGNKKIRKIQVQKQGIKVSNGTLRGRKKVNDASIGA